MLNDRLSRALGAPDTGASGEVFIVPYVAGEQDCLGTRGCDLVLGMYEIGCKRVSVHHEFVVSGRFQVEELIANLQDLQRRCGACSVCHSTLIRINVRGKDSKLVT